MKMPWIILLLTVMAAFIIYYSMKPEYSVHNTSDAHYLNYGDEDVSPEEHERRVLEAE